GRNQLRKRKSRLHLHERVNLEISNSRLPQKGSFFLHLGFFSVFEKVDVEKFLWVETQFYKRRFKKAFILGRDTRNIYELYKFFGAVKPETEAGIERIGCNLEINRLPGFVFRGMFQSGLGERV